MSTKSSRDALLARAAELRALLIGELNRSGAGLTLRALYDAHEAKLSGMGVDDNIIRNILDRAARNELIFKRTEGRNVVYYSAPYVDVKNSGSQEDPPAKVRKVKAPVVPTTQPALTIDIVKSTGRIRLDVGGFVIDIGIKD